MRSGVGLGRQVLPWMAMYLEFCVRPPGHSLWLKGLRSFEADDTSLRRTVIGTMLVLPTLGPSDAAFPAGRAVEQTRWHSLTFEPHGEASILGGVALTAIVGEFVVVDH